MLTPLKSFEDFAYQHDWFMHCPTSRNGLGCDCQCPKAGKEVVDMGAPRFLCSPDALAHPHRPDTDWRYSCVDRWKAAQTKGWHFATATGV